ncbi:MAG: aldo/keto reductase [Micropruina sp.]
MTMTYGRIPGIAKPIARLVQGTVMLTSKDLKGSFALLDSVFEQGGTTFDTAEVYGDGDCERTLGLWLHERRLRDEVVIIGKGAHPHAGRPRVTPEDITADVDTSLARMGVDLIEVYLLHRDDPGKPVGPIVEVLNDLVRAGKIGAFGGSNWRTARIAEANAYAAEHALIPFVASSPHFSLADQLTPPWDGCVSLAGPSGASERAWYAANPMAIIPWSSLAGGFFSGRYSRDNLDTFDRPNDLLCVETYGSESNFQRLDRAVQLGHELGLSPTQVALAYVVNSGLDTFPLTGPSTGEHFRHNLAACAVTLTPEDVAWLDLSADHR